MSYSIDSEQFKFSIPSQIFNINGQKIISREIVISSLPSSKNSLIQIGDATLFLDQDLIFDVSKNDLQNPILEYRLSTTTNLLAQFNPSFEHGLWKPDVWDCTENKDGNLISMQLASEGSDGKKSLLLSSRPGNACLGRIFDVTLDHKNIYRLSFDYNIKKGHMARYFYRITNDKNEKFEYFENIQANDIGWQHFEKNIDIPAIRDINYLDIHFYAPAENGGESLVAYDNIVLEEYNLANTYHPNLNISFATTTASGVELELNGNILSCDMDRENLLKEELASFESGLWASNVWDCTPDKQNNNISMQLSNDASNGTNSVLLSSEPGNACTNYTFDVNLQVGFTYKLLFDYKLLRGKNIQYYYFLLGSGKTEGFSQNTLITTQNKWSTFEVMINPSIIGIDRFNLFLYAPAVLQSESEVLYDNIQLIRWLPKNLNSYYLYAEQEVDETPKLKAVEFKPINRWKNKVILHGVNNSSLLVYPTKYSSKWKAYPIQSQNQPKQLFIPDNYSVPEVESNRQADRQELESFIDESLISAMGDKFVSKNFDGSIRNDNLDNGKFYQTWSWAPIPEDIHYQVNNYGNAWWIDINDLCNNKEICRQNPDGTYEIELIVEHGYYRIVVFGLIAGSLVLVGCFGWLACNWKRRGGTH